MENRIERNISISAVLKEFIVPLNREEFKQLELNLRNEGCRDPLVVWKKPNGKHVLVDGHNRLQICQKHNLPYKLEVRNFKNVKEVKMWMINNQLGRRNLNPLQLSYYRGVKYESVKKNWGGKEYTKTSYLKGMPPKKDQKTLDLLAREFKVSRMTIHRDAKFARALDRIGQKNPILKNRILSGEVKIKKSSILLFSNIDEGTFKTIKNEADLINKANILKSQLTGDSLASSEPEPEVMDNRGYGIMESQIFEAPNQRIQRIKGRILSAVNQAIEQKNVRSMKELKALIDKLESLLLPDIR